MTSSHKKPTKMACFECIDDDLYCPHCAPNRSAEYDPEDWEIPLFTPTPLVDATQVALLAEMIAQSRIEHYVAVHVSNLFQWSARFLLRKMRLVQTDMHLRIAHRYLRERQYIALRTDAPEVQYYGETHMRASLLKAIKNFDDIFNVSPMWALRQIDVKAPTRYDYFLALYSIDLLLKTHRKI